MNTCTPLSKLTRILSGVCWKLRLQKRATQIWQNANLKNEMSMRIGALYNAMNFIKHFAD